MKFIKIKIIANAQEASNLPPLGPVLGQHQINSMAFCQEFNDVSVKYLEGLPLRVLIKKIDVKNFNFIILKPSLSFFVTQFLLYSNTGTLLMVDKKLKFDLLFDLIKLDFEFSLSTNFIAHVLGVLATLSAARIHIIF